MEVSGERYALSVLLPGKELSVPIGEEDGWTSEATWSQWLRGNSHLPGTELHFSDHQA